jgi:hypothetical protein
MSLNSPDSALETSDNRKLFPVREVQRNLGTVPPILRLVDGEGVPKGGEQQNFEGSYFAQTSPY